MIEPWVSAWSRFVYRNFHHEPFLPDASDWTFAESGPLSGANGALPWIVFERDRVTFSGEFRQWRIDSIRPTMPFRYLLSGGVSLRSLMPGWTFGAWRGIERALDPWMSEPCHVRHDRTAADIRRVCAAAIRGCPMTDPASRSA